MDAFAALKNAVNKDVIFAESSVRDKIRVLVHGMEPADSENTRSYENFAGEDNNWAAVSVFKLDAAGKLFDEVIDVPRIFDKKMTVDKLANHKVVASDANSILLARGIVGSEGAFVFYHERSLKKPERSSTR